MIVSAFAAGGVATGTVAQSGGLRDWLEASGGLVFDDVTWYPLDGASAERVTSSAIAVDAMILATAEGELAPPVHASWHPLILEAGPYRIYGDLPTQPGFDPGRALSRPGGTFLLLRDVRVELIGRDDAPAVTPLNWTTYVAESSIK